MNGFFIVASIAGAIAITLFVLSSIQESARRQERVEVLEMKAAAFQSIIFDLVVAMKDNFEIKMRLVAVLLDDIKMHRDEHLIMIVIKLIAKGHISFSDLRTAGIGGAEFEDLFRKALASMPKEVQTWKQFFVGLAPNVENVEKYDLPNVSRLLSLVDGTGNLDFL